MTDQPSPQPTPSNDPPRIGEMVESAERYERALADLRSSMSKIGTTIASELMVPAERFTTWIRTGFADGDGGASREKARRAFAAMQKGEGRLDASAARAGVVAGPKIEDNGSVSVVVQRPGPDTNVRTSASGELFKNVTLQRGRTMASAGGT